MVRKGNVIYNNIIPFKGYKAMSLFGLIFARTELSDEDINHENIHARQCLELLGLPFYVLYSIEWIIRLLIYRNTKKAYHSISFEREAYDNENDNFYLSNRKLYAWIKYFK